MAATTGVRRRCAARVRLADWAMSVARVATFDNPPHLRGDDSRRAQTLYELLRSLPGFERACYLPGVVYREVDVVYGGDSESSLVAAERAVNDRPIASGAGYGLHASSVGSSRRAFSRWARSSI
jgi:hypothetical protein